MPRDVHIENPKRHWFRNLSKRWLNGSGLSAIWALDPPGPARIMQHCRYVSMFTQGLCVQGDTYSSLCLIKIDFLLMSLPAVRVILRNVVLPSIRDNLKRDYINCKSSSTRNPYFSPSPVTNASLCSLLWHTIFVFTAQFPLHVPAAILTTTIADPLVWVSDYTRSWGLSPTCGILSNYSKVVLMSIPKGHEADLYTPVKSRDKFGKGVQVYLHKRRGAWL